MQKDQKFISLTKDKNEMNTELLEKIIKLNEKDIYIDKLLKEKEKVSNKI